MLEILGLNSVKFYILKCYFQLKLNTGILEWRGNNSFLISLENHTALVSDDKLKHIWLTNKIF